MINLWQIAWTQMKLTSRARAVMFVLMVLPLLLITILGAALSQTFGEGDVQLKPLKVALVNQDQGVWSERLLSYLKAPDMQGIGQVVERDTREEAVELLRTAAAEYAVIIPAGFGADLVQGKEASWELIAGQDSGQNKIAESLFTGFLNRLNSVQAAMLAAGAGARQAMLPETEPREDSGQEAYVQVGKLGKEGHDYSAIQYYACAMLVMFMLYSGMMAAIALVGEREEHTLARLTALPVTMNQIIGGKVLGHTMLSLLQAVVIIGFTRYVYGVDWGNSPLLLAGICGALIVSSMSIAMLVTAWTRTIKAATAVFQFIIIIMTFISGGFISSLPPSIELIGKASVNYWAMQGMLHLMVHDQAAALSPLAVLAGVAALLVLASGMTFRKVGYRE
ncbi:ABC transporter permease [Paenibacillus puerhi]|uniref:ABC transporter permease n=1 Tax=Paenibacillus puerhi TaxID=2692622 RepID=UPI00135C01DD|nr:ABC transporter permease [Paenibacillus puerhi]